MKKYSAIGSVIIFALMISCNKDKPSKCLKFNGNVVVEERIIPYFTSISVEGDVVINIKQDTFCSVQVKGGKNMIPWIETTVTNGILTIKNKNRCNFLRSYKNALSVNLTLKEINHLEYTATSDIKFSDTIRTSYFEINEPWGAGSIVLPIVCDTLMLNNHTGPMDVIASGKATQLFLYTAGNGYLNTTNLITQHVWATNRGTGDFHVNVQNDLTVFILHTGDIYYKGNPTIVSTISGSGNLIHE